MWGSGFTSKPTCTHGAMVAHLTFNQVVTGSSPVGYTHHLKTLQTLFQKRLDACALGLFIWRAARVRTWLEIISIPHL